MAKTSYYNGKALAAFIDARKRMEPEHVTEKEHEVTLWAGRGAHRKEFRTRKQASYTINKLFLNGRRMREVDRSRMWTWRCEGNATLITADDFLMYYGYSLDDFESWCEAEGIDWRTPNPDHRRLSGLDAPPSEGRVDVLA
jgi:hypothetical protein